MRINNNLMAMNTHRQLGVTNNNGGKSMEKLSSGFRINRAGDDAAGLAISEKMRAQIRGLNQASRNSQDGISMIQTAEGALTETHAILQRMRELAVQAANDTNVDQDRDSIQNELTQLRDEIDRIARDTEFNTQKLLDGGASQSSKGGGSAVSTGTELDFSSALDFTGGKTFTIDGTDVTVTGTFADIDALVTGIETALTAASIDGVTVSNDGDKLVLTSSEAFELGGADIADFGLTAGEVKATGGAGDGFTATFQVGANSGQTFDISIADMSAKGLGLTDGGSGGSSAVSTGTELDFSSALDFTGGKTFTIDGTDVTVTGTFADIDALVTGIETALTAASIDGVTVSNDGDKLVLTSSEAFELGGADIADFGLTAGEVKATGGAGGLDVSDNSKANDTLDTIDAAIKLVSEQRSKLGAWQNRLEHTIKNLDTSSENLQAAESRIRDVDMAKEMMEFTKNNILQQAAQAMLAQANQQPQGVLQLLR